MNVLFSFHNTDTNHPTFTMKALSSPDGSPRPRTSRRPSKPLMEKRRRERINHSLETIRLLMLDNTNDEKLKNPKVEKAEILESVVHFLMKDKAVNRMAVSPRAQRPTRGRQHSYQDGMRSCLMRVSHYIASNRQTDQASVTSNEPHTHSTPASPSPGHVHGAMMPATPGSLAAGHGTPPHPYLSQTPADLHGDSSKLLSPSAALMNLNDPVWRPWPQ